MTTAYQGDPYQTPLTYRARASRQSEAAPPAPRSDRARQPFRRPLDATADDNPDAWEEARPHTSAYRYDVPTTRQTTQFHAKPTRVIRRLDRATLVIWVCLGFIIMLVGWWLLSWVANWWQGVTDTWQYGIPRTFQADHYVGLGDSPAHPDHFIALNLHGVIEVIQLNPQDQSKDAVYVLTSVDNASLPASLSFRDVDGDGKMDIIVTIGDSNPYSIVLLNNGKTFQPAPSTH